MKSTERITADQIIRILNLEPLPIEGGMFRQSYVSTETIPPQALPARYGTVEKPFGTAIYYLLTDQPDSFSAFHRLKTDEVFHFYLGDVFEMTLLYPSGESRQIRLGQDLLNGELLQFCVPAGVWQGSRVAPGGSYSLIGTTMAPGYTDEDYENGDRETLIRQYPAEKDKILLLTR